MLNNCPRGDVFTDGMELVLDTGDSVDHARLQIPAIVESVSVD